MVRVVVGGQRRGGAGRDGEGTRGGSLRLRMKVDEDVTGMVVVLALFALCSLHPTSLLRWRAVS